MSAADCPWKRSDGLLAVKIHAAMLQILIIKIFATLVADAHQGGPVTLPDALACDAPLAIMWAAGQDRSTSDTCIHQTLPVPSVKGIWHGAAWLVCAYHLGCGCPDQQHAAQG